jgi:hypothetical protein
VKDEGRSLPARQLWRLFEPIHAVTYFASEAVESAIRVGYRGSWMGYFACRLAPLGPVGPHVATALCYGFAPSRVARALPDAWAFAAPEEALSARIIGATATLRRVGADTPKLKELADLMWEAALNADTAGRVLAAGNQALPRPDDPLGVVWQSATTLREHRGDGHNAALVTADVTPVQAHWLKIAAGETDARTLTLGRGWPDEAWEQERRVLQARGWLDTDATLTLEGRDARDRIEQQTDTAAASPWTHLGVRHTERLAQLISPLTEAVRLSGIIPVSNAIGLR